MRIVHRRRSMYAGVVAGPTQAARDAARVEVSRISLLESISRRVAVQRLGGHEALALTAYCGSFTTHTECVWCERQAGQAGRRRRNGAHAAQPCMAGHALVSRRGQRSK